MLQAGSIIIGALKAVGGWVLSNPNIALEAVDKVVKSKEDKERLQNAEEKINQLGAAALELDQKIDTELESLRKQIRTMKITMIAAGAVLAVAVIAALLLAIL